MTVSSGVPLGVVLLQKCFNLGENRRAVYQASTLILTFIAYTSFHMSRRPLAIVKNSLNRDCSKLTPPDDIIITHENQHNWCDWPPFDGRDANRLLGILDSVYVFAYAICMFMSGMIAERIDLRYYLSIGMLLSGIFTYLFGLAYYLDIHSYAFFVLVQLVAGAVQCTGWPGVVSCVANWFGKERRGLVFGVWNAHLYVGNILGAYVAGYFVVTNWGLSFMIPAILVGGIGFILYLFLVPYPEDVGFDDTGLADSQDSTSLPSPDISDDKTTVRIPVKMPCFPNERSNSVDDSNQLPQNIDSLSQNRKTAITFLGALKIPGVVEFSLCLFFSKLVSYTFLFWLPRYLSHSTGMGSQEAAYVSIAFDVGGILGGIAAGIISDVSGSSAMTCVGFLGLAPPFLFIYQAYGSVSIVVNIILQIICGALVNGPYALITTAVSAELGTHPTIQNNAKALSTVTAIIDGTGSIGAALGPLLAGMISEISWTYVFYMMMITDLCALIALLRPARKEFQTLYSESNLQFTLRDCPCLPCCRSNRSAYQQI